MHARADAGAAARPRRTTVAPRRRARGCRLRRRRRSCMCSAPSARRSIPTCPPIRRSSPARRRARPLAGRAHRGLRGRTRTRARHARSAKAEVTGKANFIAAARRAAQAAASEGGAVEGTARPRSTQDDETPTSLIGRFLANRRRALDRRRERAAGALRHDADRRHVRRLERRAGTAARCAEPDAGARAAQDGRPGCSRLPRRLRRAPAARRHRAPRLRRERQSAAEPLVAPTPTASLIAPTPVAAPPPSEPARPGRRGHRLGQAAAEHRGARRQARRTALRRHSADKLSRGDRRARRCAPPLLPATRPPNTRSACAIPKAAACRPIWNSPRNGSSAPPRRASRPRSIASAASTRRARA